ncbi:MAG: hypothetical protein LAT55_04960 [Opitutales bacterium]|nr:hypothetical protein [Opitutales bacterium]
MSKNPNPQGKGNLPVLRELSKSSAVLSRVLPKKWEQVSRELFTSLFVLESNFRFQPVSEQEYWLYYQDEDFCLSLLSPAEKLKKALPVGKCYLQSDLTWSLELTDEAIADRNLQSLLEERQERFAEKLAAKGGLDELLPHYQESIPFTQRVMLFALGHSLRASLERSGEKERYTLTSGPASA